MKTQTTCVECGRTFDDNKFDNHTCKPAPTVIISKRTPTEELYHQIIVDKQYQKLSKMTNDELDVFMETLLEQEPGIVSPTKNIQKLYVSAYGAALQEKVKRDKDFERK